MSLLIDLGDVIGDRAGVQAKITRLIDEHPDDWSCIAVSALAWAFAEHTRLDPDTTQEGSRHE